jgi:hypothetical protein
MWNVHERIAAGMPKTNNAIEGWHRAFTRTVAADHPTPFHLTAVIRQEQNNTETFLAQVPYFLPDKPALNISRNCHRGI